MAYKRTLYRHPRSILSSLDEPLLDPKDGHGARSKFDVMVLKLWQLAQAGGKEGDAALYELLDIITDDDLATLKAARGKRQRVTYGGGAYKMRSLIAAMTRLRMISVETVAVPPERDGFSTVTERQKISVCEWFAAYAFERPGVCRSAVEGVCGWLADGGIQRPERSEGHD